ncbi:DUF1796 family putative cysteine peptidase [Alicyclobacillus dauci]|uniref:Papain-like cysteine peptidase n=1 Tax=Alicyclobacillus dauci TaxID=1475485 RepID=A0ABY6Z5B5_9BACL|nr:DUF1796 family putative cysteine peptidase [Alicyclobacillus dauci]WAH37521.1 papain-like cysteine peptidase [Alicyclobacillus dauci]
MRLKDLMGTYNAIFSLGDLCLASIQLRKNNLRPFAGVLDWMASPSLSDVNRLLRNRFAGFMEMSNLRVIGYAGTYAEDDTICVSDDAYNIVSNHDFLTNKNTISNLSGYSEVRYKLDRRIQRFLEKAATCEKILFIRTEGAFKEVLELHETLSGLVKNDFRILIINHTNVSGIVEKHWPIDKVCAIELPDKDKWNANDHYWSSILTDIHLNF